MSKKLYTLLSVLVLAAMLLSACGGAAATTVAPEPTEVEVVEPEPTEEPTEVMTEAPTEVMTEAPTEVMTEAPTEEMTEEPTEAATEEATEALTAPEGFKACQVTDTGGIDDKSFNATAWKGVTDAMDAFGIEGKYLESQQQTDYERNINLFIEEGCNLIVTVGFLLGDATQAAATANPDQKFSIVDFAYDPVLPNVLGQTFNTQEAAFLAGYVAAAVSQTGIVGTFGGLQIPPVTVFMDGFALGVAHYNAEKGTNVQVLGWNPETQEGLFTGNFESTDDGRTMGESLMDEGADIIMPVAGPVGLGTAAAAMERGNVYIIGVDTDWFVTAPDYADIILTSVLKNMDITTFNAIRSVIDESFAGGVTNGTLENGGVGLADFHNMTDMVPSEVVTELETVREGLISGELQALPGQ
jgi:basic membrane protein A